jgi:hypothetical protein
MATRIAGIALLPRESRNGIYYDVEELKKFDGVRVDLRVEHQGPDSKIGEVLFKYDEKTQQVKYEADVTNVEWQGRLDREQYQVSIGAKVLEQRELCDEMKKKCLNSPVLDEILELSVVKTPGIPESTMVIIEHNVDTLFILENDIPVAFGGFLDGQRLLGEISSTLTANQPDMSPEDITRRAQEIVTQMEKGFMGIINPPQPVTIAQPENTSNIPITDNLDMTTSETSEKKVEEKVKVTIETDGEVEVAKQEAKPVDTPQEVAKPTEEVKADVSEKVAQRIEKSNADTLKTVIETVSKAWQPKSEVAESTDSFVEEAYDEEFSKKFLDKVFENGYGKLVIDKEGFINSHTYTSNQTNVDGTVREAISTSGTIPGVKQTSNIKIQLGAKSVIPTRQFGRFEQVPTGQNTARFYRMTVPDAGAITESPTTDITAATHTLTSIDVTCNVRGWRQTVEKAELEDYPASFLNAIRETARLEAIRDEHKLIVQDLAATDHDFGGVSTAPYHIGASDGVATTTTTEEDADGEFDEDGLSFAKRYLGELGNSTAPGNLIAFISERAFESLSTASTLSEYAQIGNPSVTKLGQLERLYGIDIIVTNDLLTANNATRNLVCVKGEAWGLASQRNMEIELQKNIAGQYWDIVWTHRIGVDIIDPNSYVIVSSVQA